MDQMDYGAVLPPSLMVFLFSKREGFPWSLLLQRCLCIKLKWPSWPTRTHNRPLPKRTKLLAKVWPNRTYSRPLPKRTNILAKFWQASSLLCRLRSSRQGGGDVGNDDNDDNGEEMNIKMLRMSVPGEPGVVSHPPYSNGIA